jgi:hypothetical protein
MRFLHSLLLLTIIALLGSCGSSTRNQLPTPKSTAGMRGVAMIVKSVALKPGDHADVMLGDNGSATTILKDVEVISVSAADKTSVVVTVIVSPEQAEQIAEADSEHLVYLKPTGPN